MFSERIEYLANRVGHCSSDPQRATFAAHLIAEKTRLDNLHRLAEQIIASNCGTAVGAELAFQAPNGTRYCAILEEPDSSGQGRIVYFDADALHRHQVHGHPPR
ncbi:MAG: hypothetical protein IPI02_23000, partial [Sterolibacteriaceae bacterium]|nr:hypothetical protein [Sterolibacteriaceae bacterium]